MLPPRIESLSQSSNQWSSPAFLKRSRAPPGLLFQDVDERDELDDYMSQSPSRKRPRFGRGTGGWKYTGQSPSPPVDKASPINTVAGHGQSEAPAVVEQLRRTAADDAGSGEPDHEAETTGFINEDAATRDGKSAARTPDQPMAEEPQETAGSTKTSVSGRLDNQLSFDLARSDAAMTVDEDISLVDSSAPGDDSKPSAPPTTVLHSLPPSPTLSDRHSDDLNPNAAVAENPSPPPSPVLIPVPSQDLPQVSPLVEQSIGDPDFDMQARSDTPASAEADDVPVVAAAIYTTTEERIVHTEDATGHEDISLVHEVTITEEQTAQRGKVTELEDLQMVHTEITTSVTELTGAHEIDASTASLDADVSPSPSDATAPSPIAFEAPDPSDSASPRSLTEAGGTRIVEVVTGESPSRSESESSSTQRMLNTGGQDSEVGPVSPDVAVSPNEQDSEANGERITSSHLDEDISVGFQSQEPYFDVKEADGSLTLKTESLHVTHSDTHPSQATSGSQRPHPDRSSASEQSSRRTTPEKDSDSKWAVEYPTLPPVADSGDVRRVDSDRRSYMVPGDADHFLRSLTPPGRAPDRSPPPTTASRERSPHEADQVSPPSVQELEEREPSVLDSAVLETDAEIVKQADPAASKSESQNDLLSVGLRTPHAYFTPLSALAQSFNLKIDVLAVITHSSRAVHASTGPRDFYLTLRVLDPSNTGSPTTVQIFRPFKEALPHVEEGNTILLRAFKVTSSKRKLSLLSTEESAWVVWPGGGRAEEVQGPPVEYGAAERERMEALQTWWNDLDQKTKLKA